MEYKTPLEVLVQVAADEPDLPFLQSGSSNVITYSDALKRIRGIANFLLPYVQQLEDSSPLVVALHVTAEVDFVLGVYAIWLLQGTACVFNKVLKCAGS